jgi:lipopolysaccharide biosynthesis regulator YciM
VTEPVPSNIELVSNKTVVQSVIEKIDEVYKQIKKKEENPNMDYLYSNMEKQNNAEKTFKKLEIIENMTSIAPRTNP